MGFIKAKPVIQHLVAPIQIQVPMHRVEWSKLVSLDFETYYDEDYTLSKLSTSEYIRDPRFEALMVGVKIGRRKTVVVPGPKIKAYLAKIDWKSHSLLCHNTQFDGFILSHHYKVVPRFYYCTMSMGRGLHSNEIGAGLDEVAKFYGREGKLVGGVEGMKGSRYKDLVKLGKYEAGAKYCGRDVDEMYGIFEQMVAKMPDDEIGLIDLTVRMFCDPVLRVNIPRVEAELAREIAERERLFMNVVPHDLYEKPGQEKELKALLKTGAERELQGKERIMLKAKRILGSNEKFADLLRAEGVEPPVKISPAWIKKPVAERKDEDKWAYAFAKDDADFVNLPDDVESLAAGLDLNKKADVKLLVKRQERLRLLVDCRLATKSTTNITRAQRLLTAGQNGMRLPAGYAYARAHTLRWSGINKMNLQNLTRGGELRQSIEAESSKHELCVSDSGQIEARVNGWFWGQDDLLEAFVAADRWDDAVMGMATGPDRDAYCKFADAVYGFEVTKKDKTERFVGKCCVLGLGFQMGPPKLQVTLAKGALGGPPVFFTLDECKKIVNTYRLKNYKIVAGWKICERIIEDMAAGRTGSHKCISWGKETIHLPNGLTLKYPQLKKVRNEEKGWEEWTYMSGVIRKKLYGGLLCLGADTEVLTDRGWCAIIDVSVQDRLWDGEEWVAHGGLQSRGVKEVIDFGGVKMTADHQILVDGEWIEARQTSHSVATSSCERHYGFQTRDAASGAPRRVGWSEDVVGVPLRLRQEESDLRLGFQERRLEFMRVHDVGLDLGVSNDSRDVAPPELRSMAEHDPALYESVAQSLEELWWAWDHSGEVVDDVRRVLEGHAEHVQARTDTRPEGQQFGVFEEKLSVGDVGRTSSEPQVSAYDQYTSRAYASLASRGGFGPQQNDVAVSGGSRLAGSEDVRQAEVFDLINAGPRARFTVRGSDGRSFIVHNCENLIQCLARIIVGWQMLQISKKYRVVMTTHDEVVVNVLAIRAAAALKFMLKWMRTPPEWCADIPLNAEGGHAPNYSK